jgi:hypothetical protein
MFTLSEAGLISSLPLEVETHQLDSNASLKSGNSLEPVNLIHVVRRWDLESGSDVGQVHFTLGLLGLRIRRLGSHSVRAFTPALFPGSANIGSRSLLEWLSLERNSGHSATTVRGISKKKATSAFGNTYSGMKPNSIRPSASLVPWQM